ncbi:translation initiation factor IF-2 [Schlesneria paludicola]|uniref:translation initiation factor IF-2 n=1 Tax=Schlesneria paludicola TaxID=360056 RepID=UPI00029A8309|nr:translation initiation factor IF-2 [Schlesneria paludicola]
MKIRIFALAKELDIDSKLLIDYCAKAGITIKNSALASISPEEKDRVLGVMRSATAGSAPASTAVAAAAPAKASPVMASREPAADLALKPRPIRVMGAKPPLMVPRSRISESEPPKEEAPAPVEHEEIAVPAEPPEVVVAETVTPPLEEVVAEEVAEVVDVAPPPPVAVVEPVEKPVAAPVPAAPMAPVSRAPSAPKASEDDRGILAPPPSASPRGDFAPPSLPQRSMRTMVSRGTADMGGAKAGAPIKKAKPSGPLIAEIPRFKAPPVVKTPKPEDATPQRPVQRFNAETPSKEAPLGQILRKRPETTSKKKPGDEETDDSKVKKHVGGASLQEARNQRRKVTLKDIDEEEDRGGRGSRVRPKPHRRSGPVPLKSTAELELPLTVRSLSEGIGRPAKAIMQILWQRGDMVTINSALEEDVAIEICLDLGVDLQIRREKTIEDEVTEVVSGEDRPEDLLPRPPIITILGHVDHGKTTLVDKLRSANVAASEYGGITQHIAAYQIEHNGHKLTFVDTPGHAAFGEMRARGAHVTDIVVLVVAANDGVMPQTVECISHTRAAGVPMVVAMNKIDLPERNEQRVLTELSAQNVLASEWGGDVEVVRTSGLTGQGLSELLDTLLLTAELHEFTANPNRPASGVCLEAFRDEGRGPLAWLIVQRGTLRLGDVILCGTAYGRIRAMYNERDEELQEALPSTPIKVAGLDIVPGAGEQFLVLSDVDAARDAAETRRQKGRASVLANMGGKRTLEDILNAAAEGQVQDLAVIVKADSPGSLEALRSELSKFEHDEVRVKVLHEGVGGVNESDVYLASASNAVIFAFHVIADDRAQLLAQQEGVEIRRYNIIYEVMDEIRRILEGMLRPEQKEVATGRAIVLRTFSITRFGTIAGCRVLNGNIERSSRIHLIRDQKIINTYSIASLKREKDDAREVREGMECGIRLENFNDIKEGDLLEAFKIEEVKRTL